MTTTLSEEDSAHNTIPTASLRGGLFNSQKFHIITMEKFNSSAFVREVFLRSNPSVDLNDITDKNPIRPGDYTIKESELNIILRKYGVIDENGIVLNRDLNMAVCFWLLNQGPLIVNDNPKTV